MFNVGLGNGQVLFAENFDNVADAFKAYCTVQHIKGARIIEIKVTSKVTLPTVTVAKIQRVPYGKRALPGSNCVKKPKGAGVCSSSLWGW